LTFAFLLRSSPFVSSIVRATRIREIVASAAPAKGLPFDEGAVRKYFMLDERAQLLYDPLAYVLLKPDISAEYTWEEHPKGVVLRRTNNMGFNEDGPTEIAKRGVRVLVSGDSHTEGVVFNDESFTNVAERKLRGILGRKDVEFLNSGVGYTSPTCYLGVLRKYLMLEPDTFVAVLFTGNDFLDEICLGQRMSTVPEHPVPDSYFAKCAEVAARWEGAFPQGLNQAFRFKMFPEEPDLALASVLRIYAEMKALCDQHGIAFLAVALPTKMDVDEDDQESWEAACAALGIERSDVELNARIARRFLEGARAAGIRCLDPTEAMRMSREVLYWKKDYHLSVVGHALLGELIAREIAQML